MLMTFVDIGTLVAIVEARRQDGRPLENEHEEDDDEEEDDRYSQLGQASRPVRPWRFARGP